MTRTMASRRPRPIDALRAMKPLLASLVSSKPIPSPATLGSLSTLAAPERKLDDSLNPTSPLSCEIAPVPQREPLWPQSSQRSLSVIRTRADHNNIPKPLPRQYDNTYLLYHYNCPRRNGNRPTFFIEINNSHIKLLVIIFFRLFFHVVNNQPRLC